MAIFGLSNCYIIRQVHGWPSISMSFSRAIPYPLISLTIVNFVFQMNSTADFIDFYDREFHRIFTFWVISNPSPKQTAPYSKIVTPDSQHIIVGQSGSYAVHQPEEVCLIYPACWALQELFNFECVAFHFFSAQRNTDLHYSIFPHMANPPPFN